MGKTGKMGGLTETKSANYTMLAPLAPLASLASLASFAQARHLVRRLVRRSLLAESEAFCYAGAMPGT
jgi:hypothetical protein